MWVVHQPNILLGDLEKEILRVLESSLSERWQSEVENRTSRIQTRPARKWGFSSQ